MDGMPMMMNSSSMAMTFYFGRKVTGGLLFREWRVESAGELVGAVIAVFCLAVLYEGFKTLREYLVYRDAKYHNLYGKGDKDENSDEVMLLSNNIRRVATKPKDKGWKFYSVSFTMHSVQSALHVIQVGYGYLLMLVAMTYNGWLFLSICFGAGVGYFIFAKSRHLMGNFREQNEHCQ